MDTVRALASLIVQADKFGTSIGKAAACWRPPGTRPAGCRGAVGQNHGEAGLPAGAVDLSVAALL